MATTRISIQLDRGPWPEPGKEHWYPSGGTLSGCVVVHAEKRIKRSWLELKVVWQTTGRGLEDKEIAWRDAFQVEMPEAGEVVKPFTVDLPHGPISLVGSCIQIRWEIKAELNLMWKLDPTDSHAFEVIAA